ncbi:hypothetical protein F511_37960 [Dorcoceras hygrometricum]|uniref:Uncharacterized protein n=1 Tax=Dorcoceras hygrometricum TaxID=472368 RepID=A0A2Z7AHG7_9LAMI|nr:hypothetical protein F511_37960 [Dorcoceras hygrometricum]
MLDDRRRAAAAACRRRRTCYDRLYEEIPSVKYSSRFLVQTDEGIKISVRYSEGSKTDVKKSNLIDEERANSTAEVFRKVAEERTAAGRGAGGGRNAEKTESSSESSESEAKEPPPGNVNSG